MMMDRRDAERVIQNLRTKPFLCSDSCILLDNGYVILKQEYYDELRRTWELISEDAKLVSLN